MDGRQCSALVALNATKVIVLPLAKHEWVVLHKLPNCMLLGSTHGEFSYEPVECRAHAL